MRGTGACGGRPQADKCRSVAQLTAVRQDVRDVRLFFFCVCGGYQAPFVCSRYQARDHSLIVGVKKGGAKQSKIQKMKNEIGRHTQVRNLCLIQMCVKGQIVCKSTCERRITCDGAWQ
jgi:hypothetical protein